MTVRNTVIAIVGPTAIGKTRLSIALAQHFNCPIVSADSRQFFKEMRIGTAVPEPEELAAAKHYFIQNKSIHQDYSVGDFEAEALELLDELFKTNKVVVVVGGSGLYVSALLKGLNYFPNIDPKIREQLNTQLAQDGLEALTIELKQLDPEHYQRIDIHNPHRVIRALEVCLGTGKPYSSFLNKAKSARNFNTIKIGLTAPRTVVYSRINERVDQMIAHGLKEEAQHLFEYKELNALQTVGYRELFEHFEGNCSLEEAIEKIKQNTRRFAKRQGTWFSKDTQIQWFDYQTPTEDIIKSIKKELPE